MVDGGLSDFQHPKTIQWYKKICVFFLQSFITNIAFQLKSKWQEQRGEAYFALQHEMITLEHCKQIAFW